MDNKLYLVEESKISELHKIDGLDAWIVPSLPLSLSWQRWPKGLDKHVSVLELLKKKTRTIYI